MSYIEEMSLEVWSKLSELSPYDVLDTIPSNYDFVGKKIAVEYKIGENVLDQVYKNQYTLQIRIVGNFNSQLYKILNLAEFIDKEMNKAEILESRITRESPYMTSYNDEDKHNVVLQYLINRY